MGRTATMTLLFSDIVGSTDLLTRLGEHGWDEVRRQHFSVLREALAEHDGVEVKNTGDGLMAVFGSAINAVDCALAMQQQALQVVVGGTPVGLRIGIATGEATHDQGDWFGTPVVEAARLCALAGTNESWATGLVRVLAGSQSDARFVSIEPQSLKGFDHPVEVFNIESPERSRGSMFAQVERHEQLGERLVGYLDYWESLPSLQTMQVGVFAELAPLPGDVICDIGFGTGSELIRIARSVGPQGTAIGVDPSTTMIEATRDRAQREGLAVELVARDGRDTGLPAGRCDAVRMERVVQHVGDLGALLAEAKRITRPGGRIVIADTDWGSLMIHPGDRDLIRRFKTALETGPMAEPWAGRTLHDAMLASGLTDVTSRIYPITARRNAGRPPLVVMLDQLVEARLATQSEIDDLVAGLDAAFERGGAVVAFSMFVASGRVP
jgi:class 3 adenylate cyclase/ubiquinone/menaquinone biosynthesis C-methylase UbiE